MTGAARIWTPYRVAGRLVATDLAAAELAPLAVRDFALDPLAGSRAPPAGRGRDASTVFDGEAWVVDRLRSVECRRDPRAYRLRIGGVGSFWVAADGSALGGSRLDSGAGRRLARLALLGPPLTLALALQGAFCLHASAIETESGVLAFAGESGAGKSTLARILIDFPLGRRRVADDILAVDLTAGRPTARLDFPQLKLSSAEQPFRTGVSSLPLRALFLLQVSPPAPRGALAPPAGRRRVEIEKLGARQSTLAVIRHTVAARLFDARLLEHQLRFAAAVARRIPVYRLSYPWDAESPPRIAEALAAMSGGEAGRDKISS